MFWYLMYRIYTSFITKHVGPSPTRLWDPYTIEKNDVYIEEFHNIYVIDISQKGDCQVYLY
jgi:hypothetical protein